MPGWDRMLGLARVTRASGGAPSPVSEELGRISLGRQRVHVERRFLGRDAEVILAEDVVAVEHGAG
jgi:hypothetical protein